MILKNYCPPLIAILQYIVFIIDTLEFMREKFGSVEDFLDEYGLDESWRKTVIENMGKKE